jgi:hypothetical protein
MGGYFQLRDLTEANKNPLEELSSDALIAYGQGGFG